MLRKELLDSLISFIMLPPLYTKLLNYKFVGYNKHKWCQTGSQYMNNKQDVFFEDTHAFCLTKIPY